MNLRQMLVGVGVLALLSAAPAAAQPVSGTLGPDSLFYYELGGGRPTSRALNPDVTTTTIGLSGEVSIGFSCGKFNPVAAITNQFANAKDDIITKLTGAASGALAALPMLALQKVNPGLYDLFQNTILRFEKVLALSTKSCEQMESEIAAGKDPFKDWMTVAIGEDWKASIGSGGDDIVTVNREVKEKSGTDGITWIGGKKKGGKGKEQISTIGDTVKAGYQITVNKKVDLDASTSAGSAPIGELWATADEAREWAVRTFGDVIISTCGTDDGCEPSKGVPGVGLTVDMEEEEDAIVDDLTALVDGSTAIDDDSLKAVSAPGIAVTERLVMAVRNLGDMSEVTTGKLAAEIALARSVNKALAARRLLLTGRSVPEIPGVEPATREIDRVVIQAQREVELLMYESRIRRELMSTTAALTLRHSDRQLRTSFRPDGVSTGNPRRIEGSVITP